MPRLAIQKELSGSVKVIKGGLEDCAQGSSVAKPNRPEGTQAARGGAQGSGRHSSIPQVPGRGPVDGATKRQKTEAQWRFELARAKIGLGAKKERYSVAKHTHFEKWGLYEITAPR